MEIQPDDMRLQEIPRFLRRRLKRAVFVFGPVALVAVWSFVMVDIDHCLVCGVSRVLGVTPILTSVGALNAFKAASLF